MSSHFIAKTPPPCASKNGPYDALLHSVIPHPALPSTDPSQSVLGTPFCSCAGSYFSRATLGLYSRQRPQCNSIPETRCTLCKDQDVLRHSINVQSTWTSVPRYLVMLVVVNSLKMLDQRVPVLSSYPSPRLCQFRLAGSRGTINAAHTRNGKDLHLASCLQLGAIQSSKMSTVSRRSTCPCRTSQKEIEQSERMELQNAGHTPEVDEDHKCVKKG